MIARSTIADISVLAEWEFNYLTDIKWSPDSAIFAVSTHDGIYFVDITTFEKKRFQYATPNWYRDIDFSPDGSELAATDGTIIFLWDIYKDKVIAELSDDICEAGDRIVYHPGGGFLASGITKGVYASDYETSIYFWDLDNRRCSPLVENLIGYLDEFSFSLDGRFLLNTELTHLKTYLWNIDTLDIACTSDGSIATTNSANNLLAVSNYKDPKNITLIDISSCGPVDTLTQSVFSTELTFSPDGSILAGAGSSSIAFWDVHAREIVHDIDNLPTMIEKILFSPDGRYFVSVIHSNSPDALYQIDLWGVAY